jgi:4-hydroxybenzoate polyprenyltransferase
MRFRHKVSLYLNLIRFNRPAGWLLLLWPTLSALWLASHGWPGWHLVLVFTLGTVLMRSAGCCFNDAADRDFDKHVARTADRPVTSGKVSALEAVALGAVLALLAFGLVLTTNWLTVQWSFGALAIAAAYPFAKRWVAMPQAVLGLAFSVGIVMAFAAVQSRVPEPAYWLVAANVLWVLAYDTEYAMVDRDDDLKIGIQTSAITLGRWDVAFVMGCYAGHLVLWSKVLLAQSIPAAAAMVLIAISLLLAALQALWHFSLIRRREHAGCFRAFRANHWLGLTVFAGIAASYALAG